MINKTLPKIVIIMRVKNESRWLNTVFQSLKELSDEIIVLDDGSTDNTLEISKNCENVVDIIHQESLPFDETRDKNKLLEDIWRS